jgi:hypothetical protein
MSTEDYFSQAAILKRLNRRHRRFTLVAIHFVIALVVVVVVSTNLSIFRMLQDLSPGLAAEWSGLWQRIPGITPAMVGMLLFGLFVVHATWAALRTYAENEIDEQMREARYYTYRRRDPMPSAGLRLGDDGELVDDMDEIEYELKPKRKRYE